MVMALAPTIGPSILTCHTWYVHPFCMGVKVLACKGLVCPHPDMTVKMTWSNDRSFTPYSVGLAELNKDKKRQRQCIRRSHSYPRVSSPLCKGWLPT